MSGVNAQRENPRGERVFASSGLDMRFLGCFEGLILPQMILRGRLFRLHAAGWWMNSWLGGSAAADGASHQVVGGVAVCGLDGFVGVHFAGDLFD